MRIIGNWTKAFLLAALADLLLTATFQTCYAAPWSFAVTGDGRANPKESPVDQTGINTHVFTNLLHAIAASPIKPQFVLYTGDLVCGTNAAVSASLSEQMEAWKKIAKTELPGVPVYVVRGNHETYGDADGSLWLKEFKPLLDEDQVTYLEGEKGYSYYFSPAADSNTVVVAVDQFQPGREHRVNLAELARVLRTAKANGARHLFVMAHEMAFTCSAHGDTDNMAAFPAERNEFLRLLQTNGCSYFLAGHDHCYDWMAITNRAWPADYVLNQIVVGTAGAPFYADKGYWGDAGGYGLRQVEHKTGTYGFVQVIVDDEATTNQVRACFREVAAP
ncbi:MAG TPA: metallophosphoesterase [Verrucomicrobiae bacterium]